MSAAADAGELRIDLALARGGFALDASFAVPASGVTALFGPSGAGKTTVLRALAGLEPDARGRVVVRGEVWQESDRGVFVPPHRRRAGLVFQEPSLFPHLTVEGNLRYAWRRRARGVGARWFDDVVGWLSVGPLLARRPEGLSGGERQRVALARALAAGPRLLLLDEPLASLDRASKREILPVLASLEERLDVPVVLVTHSLSEVARLATRMVTLRDGRVEEIGPVEELLARPDLSHEPGDPLGAVIEGTVAAHDDDDWLTTLEAPCGEIHVRRVERPVGSRLRVRILARDVSLALDEEPRISILNSFACVVDRIDGAERGEALVRLRAGEGEAAVFLLARVTRRSLRALG
ncbi:MAG: molybdenum ABC transporter ATP-binding protein, partial [Planctomycetota bacterium JB042]